MGVHESQTKSISLEYDTSSIMHYDGTLNGNFPNPVMIVKKTGKGVGLNTEMSPIDIETLNKMYPCDNDKCDQNGMLTSVNSSTIFVPLSVKMFFCNLEVSL